MDEDQADPAGMTGRAPKAAHTSDGEPDGENELHSAKRSQSPVERRHRGLHLSRPYRTGAVAVLVVMTLVIAGTAFAVARFSRNSDRLTRQSVSESLAEQASVLSSTDPQLAARLALAAYRTDSIYASGSALFEVAQQNSPVTRIMAGSGQAISALTEAVNGVDLYSASVAGTIQCWNMNTGQRLANAMVSSPIEGLVAASDGHLLAGTDEQGDVLIWNTSSRRCLGARITLYSPPTPPTTEAQTVGMGFFNNDHSLYVLSTTGILTTYNLRTRSIIGGGNLVNFVEKAGLNVNLNSQQVEASSPVYMKSRRQWIIYLTTSDPEILALNLKTFSVTDALKSFKLPIDATSITAEPSTDGIVAITDYSGVTMWNLTTGHQIQSFPEGGFNVGFDGLTLAVQTSLGISLISLDGNLSTPALQALQPEQLYGGATQVLATPPGAGSLIAAGAADGSISIINPGEDRLQYTAEPASTVLAFSGDNLVLANSFYTGNRSEVLNAASPSGIAGVPTTSPGGDPKTYRPAPSWWPANEEFFANDATVGGGMLIVAGQTPDGKGVVLIWNAATARPIRELLLPGAPALAASAEYDGHLGIIVARDNNGGVDAWSSKTWEPVMSLRLGSGSGNLAISPNGMTAMAPVQFGNINGSPSTLTNKLAIIQLQTHVVREVTVRAPFHEAAYDPDGHVIALIGGNILQFLSPAGVGLAGRPAVRVPGIPLDLSYNPTGRLLALTLTDGRVLIYDAATARLAYPPIPVGLDSLAVNAAWNNAGSVLALSIGQFKGAQLQAAGTELWILDPQAWATQDCSLADGNFTPAGWREYVGTEVPFQQLCKVGRVRPHHDAAMDGRDVSPASGDLWRVGRTAAATLRRWAAGMVVVVRKAVLDTGSRSSGQLVDHAS